MLDRHQISKKVLLLTSNQEALRRMGIHKEVGELRFENTWHRQTMVRHWVSTIGLWGKVATVQKIMSVAEVDYNNLKRFRALHGLHSVADAKDANPGWMTAVEAVAKYFDRAHLPKVEQVGTTCLDLGILPIELNIYVAILEPFMQARGIQQVLALYEDEHLPALHELWEQQDTEIEVAVRSNHAPERVLRAHTTRLPAKNVRR